MTWWAQSAYGFSSSICAGCGLNSTKRRLKLYLTSDEPSSAGAEKWRYREAGELLSLSKRLDRESKRTGNLGASHIFRY